MKVLRDANEPTQGFQDLIPRRRPAAPVLPEGAAPVNDPDEDLVMQARCLYCGAQHYGPAVYAISRGEDACGSCGRTPPVFHDRAAYRVARQEQFMYRERPRCEQDPASGVLDGLRDQRARDERGES